jgi:hypothetical protein
MDKLFSPIAPITNKAISNERVSRQIKTRFKLEADFFDELLERIKDREKENRNRRSNLFRKTKRPSFGWINTNDQNELTITNLSRDILSELIETAFWASLEKEEDRSLKFSISYRCLINDETTEPNFESSDLVFCPLMPFDVKTISKLAPAIANESSILVSADENNALKITGISQFSFLPLEISVLDPGKLLIKYDLENIAVISGSEVVFIRYSLAAHTSRIWSKLFPSNDGQTLIWNDVRYSVIVNTLREMRKLGHGGILIIVPCNKKYKISIEKPIPYSTDGLFKYGSETIDSFNEKKKENKDYYGSEITDLAKYFAQLTAVDGAVLLTTKLDLIGFGIVIKKSTKKLPKIYELDSLDHSEWFTSVKELDHFGNTRHKSAANFAINQPDSVVFVVSQDGRVTAFSMQTDKENNSPTLYAYSKLELLLF